MMRVHKLYHTGQEKFAYNGEVIERTATSITLEAIYSSPLHELPYITLKPGDKFIEYYFMDRWYNFFEIYEGELFKGWYCNIARPATLEGEHLYYVDLALDYFVQPSGRDFVLDEDEFLELGLGAEEAASARAALGELQNMVARRWPPFNRLPGR